MLSPDGAFQARLVPLEDVPAFNANLKAKPAAAGEAKEEEDAEEMEEVTAEQMPISAGVICAWCGLDIAAAFGAGWCPVCEATLHHNCVRSNMIICHPHVPIPPKFAATPNPRVQDAEGCGENASRQHGAGLYEASASRSPPTPANLR